MHHNYSVLLVGSGHLGSRYLQGLINIDIPLDIYVYDKSIDSLNRARALLVDIYGDIPKLHNLHFSTELSLIAKASFNLCIIATTSGEREILVVQLNRLFDIKYWILEKVLSQSVDGLLLISSEIGVENNAWVNTPMRTMPWYSDIKKACIHYLGELTNFKVIGNGWGLCCNAIHYIDLASWLTTSSLCKGEAGPLEWGNSKRPDYMEAKGKVTFFFENSSFLQLEDHGSYDVQHKIIISGQEGQVIEIDEINQVAYLPDGNKIPGIFEFQSNLTVGLVKNLLINSSCMLPSLSESIHQHKIMLETFLSSPPYSCEAKKNILPIT